MSDIVITIRGGTFQDAFSSASGDRIIILDYDDYVEGNGQLTILPIIHDNLKVKQYVESCSNSEAKDGVDVT